MRVAAWLCIAMFLSLCGSAWAAAKDKDDDKPKTAVELTAASEERASVCGKFRLDRQALQNGKPLPKVIGMLTEKRGLTYFLIVEDQGFVEVLSSSDGRTMTLCGKVARIEEEGAFLMVDAKITRPAPPTTRTKRGGL